MAIPVFQDILPAGSSNRPGTKLPATGQPFIVVHETGNADPGADAASQIAYLRSAEARQRQVSYHFSVDDHAIVQGLPLDEIGWHAGDGCDDPDHDIGCYRSIGIEGCINRDGNEAQMRRNFAELIARIALGDGAFDWGSGSTRGRFTIDRIKQHIQVSDPGPDQHYCPEHMLEEGYWPSFLSQVRTAFGRVPDANLVPKKFAQPRTFHAQQGGLLRQGPTRDAYVVRALRASDPLTCTGYVLGQLIAGDDRWLQTATSPIRYVHASGVREHI